MGRYGKGLPDMPGEHLYAHFYEEGCKGSSDVRVKIIDKADMRKPTVRGNFWVYKWNSFVPQKLSLWDFS